MHDRKSKQPLRKYFHLEEFVSKRVTTVFELLNGSLCQSVTVSSCNVPKKHALSVFLQF